MGCLPTLRPLFNKSKLDYRHPYQIPDDTRALTDRRFGNKIQKTTSIDLKVSGVSFGDSHIDGQLAWDVEDRG